PCRTNAALAIADDRMAMVTGTNFMAGRRTSQAAAGVLMVAPVQDRPCSPIESLLEWSYELFPDYRLKQAMMVRHSHFRRLETERTDESRERHDAIALGDPSKPDEPPDDDAGDELTRSAIQAWSDHWVEYAAEIRRMAAGRTLPAVQVIRDGRHRD